MRKFASLLIFSIAACTSGAAQVSQTSTPQTARQALMEMFSTKGSGTFVKHLPAATVSALENAGALKALQQYSMLASQFHKTGSQLETFEAGPVLLANDDLKTGQKVEVIVDSDSLQGDDDNIELSFRTYKDKQLQRTPFMPRITFCMKMESGVWKLNEILFSVRVPLADPDFLKSITEGMKSRSAAMTQTQLQSSPSTITFGGDSAVVASMRSILTAENTYKHTYAHVGYTCTLSELDGFGGGEPNEHQAMLLASGLASGKKHGYVFTLSGCQGTPASSFHLAAVPAGNSFGRRAFCAEQLGAIRYSTDGSAVTCEASGVPLP
ncbi:MAG: hypothetical protein WAL52_07520 [Candidatus Sulfotelmatobacter sp.]